MTKTKRTGRGASQLAMRLLCQMERYMARAGLVAFMLEPSPTLAERMYPNMRASAPAAAPVAAPAAAPVRGADAPASSPAAASPQATDTTGQLDPEMRAIRDDLAERMYTRAEAERVVPDGIFDALVGTQVEIGGQMTEVSQDLARKSAAELRTMAADLQLSGNDVAAVNEGLTFAQSIKGDEQKTLAARESAVELLNAEHGQEAMLAARAARAYVAKNPKLAHMLERTGAGDSPQVIALIARRAVALHKAGKLTVADTLADAAGGTTRPGKATSLAQRLYPGMNP